MRKAHKILVINYEGKKLLEKPELKREDNIKIVVIEIRYENIDWIQMFQHRDRWRDFVNTAMKFNLHNNPFLPNFILFFLIVAPSNTGLCRESRKQRYSACLA
jgi:hypothetical protein